MRKTSMLEELMADTNVRHYARKRNEAMRSRAARAPKSRAGEAFRRTGGRQKKKRK